MNKVHIQPGTDADMHTTVPVKPKDFVVVTSGTRRYRLGRVALEPMQHQPKEVFCRYQQMSRA